jgi:hypothetical protein
MRLHSGSIAISLALAAVILLSMAVLSRLMPIMAPAAPALDPPAPVLAAAAPPDTAPAASQPIELLHAVPSTVAVSSTVDNAAILPEHLVDRDLETAWNSRTGDAGAWIAFRVPREVHVERIRMSAGFTHRGPRGDLFTMNPRIQQVRVTRAGSLLLDQRLDPGSRDLQDLVVDAAGGDFRIEVTELIPGTEAAWREVCVSELEVWGALPASMTPAPQQPTVRVGSLDLRPALGIRATGGATALPLAIATRGWAYLGREDVDPGRGAVRAEQTYHSAVSEDIIGLELRRAVDPAALPRRYRAARQLAIVVYGAHFEPLCEGVLGGLEVAVQAQVDELRAVATRSADDLVSDGWTAPYAVVAKIDAACADEAHWVRGADLPPLPDVVTQPPPDRVEQAVEAAFHALMFDELREEAAREAVRSHGIVYVPPATRRGHGYISASFRTDDCVIGEIARWGLWETSGKAPPKRIAGPDSYDAIDGAVDIDGDGVPEIVTDLGEIADGGYIPWIKDLHGTKPPGLGCDGLP